jgi:hypothetical protein
MGYKHDLLQLKEIVVWCLSSVTYNVWYMTHSKWWNLCIVLRNTSSLLWISKKFRISCICSRPIAYMCRILSRIMSRAMWWITYIEPGHSPSFISICTSVNIPLLNKDSKHLSGQMMKFVHLFSKGSFSFLNMLYKRRGNWRTFVLQTICSKHKPETWLGPSVLSPNLWR